MGLISRVSSRTYRGTTTYTFFNHSPWKTKINTKSTTTKSMAVKAVKTEQKVLPVADKAKLLVKVMPVKVLLQTSWPLKKKERLKISNNKRKILISYKNFQKLSMILKSLVQFKNCDFSIQ